MIEELYNAYKKGMSLTNTHPIDVSYACYASTGLPGEPLWLTPNAPSGYGKTTVVRPLMSAPNTLLLDTLTSRSLSTGDLGPMMAEKSTFILIPDIAGILATEQEAKKELFAQFRTLFDGYIKRDRARGESVFFRNIRTNMLAFSTPEVKRDLEYMSMMGTREILYTLPNQNITIKDASEGDKAEISVIAKKFIDSLDYKYKNTTPEEDEFLKQSALMITIQRVETPSNDGMLIDVVEKEIPIRLFRQLKKLWYGLDIIGTKDKKKVITEIVKGSGNSTRKKIVEILCPDIYGEEFNYRELTRKQLANILNVDPREALKQLMILRGLSCIEAKDDIFGMDTVWYPNRNTKEWGETNDDKDEFNL